MPSVGRIKQFSVVAIAAAFLGVSASSAKADNEVWLWACHMPDGDAVGSLGAPANATGTCANSDPGLNTAADALRTSLAAGNASSWRFERPPDTTLTGVKLYRNVSAMGPGQTFEVRTTTGGAPVESRGEANTPVSGIFEGTTGGDFLQFGLNCAAGCANPPAGAPTADVPAVAMRIGDSTKPKFAVGGASNPAARTLRLHVPATDTGSGLRRVQAVLQGVVAERSFASGTCDDHTPGTPAVDMPLNAPCKFVDSADLELDTTRLIDGDYTLTVTVFDWAGNSESMSQPVTVLNNVDRGTNIATLAITTAGVLQQGGGTTGAAGSGGVAGASATACRSPRLSVFLAQKPLRVRGGRPVLQRGKRYRFNGRLTCVINGRRRSAPKRTRVDLFNRVGRRQLEKAGTTIRNKGRLTIILSYRSSRTLIFRFTNNDGQRSQVRLPIRVAKR